MPEEHPFEHRVKLFLRDVGVSAVGVTQIMEEKILTDPKDRKQIRDMLLFIAGDPAWMVHKRPPQGRKPPFI